MRDGIRKCIFHTLVTELPYKTNKMLGASKIWRAVDKLIAEQDAAKAIEEVLTTFEIHERNEHGRMVYRRAKDVEEFCNHPSQSYFKTKEEILRWYATNRDVTETEEALKWLESEGYVSVQKRPARFGYKVCVGVTAKGWEVAHLYR